MKKMNLLVMFCLALFVLLLGGCTTGKATANQTVNQTICTNLCSGSGAKQCFNFNTSQTCGDYNTDGCLEWGASTVCQFGCAGSGACNACFNTCSPAGRILCGGVNIVSCADSNSDGCLELGVIRNCSYGCLNSSCLPACTNDCSPSGAKRCNGKYVQTCGNYDTDTCLEWNGGSICSEGCINGTCKVTTGTIYATSTPTGATVYVDGVNKGSTPRTITGVTPGIRQVKFTRTNYGTVIQNSTVTVGQTTNVVGTLIATHGSIYVTSMPTGAYIWIDGSLMAGTPNTLSGIKPGVRQLKLTKTNYTDYKQNVTVVAGQTTNVAVTLKK